MSFTVRYVDETALPSGHDWVIGVTGDGARFLFVKERVGLSPGLIEEAWAGGHGLDVEDLASLRLRIAV